MSADRVNTVLMKRGESRFIDAGCGDERPQASDMSAADKDITPADGGAWTISAMNSMQSAEAACVLKSGFQSDFSGKLPNSSYGTLTISLSQVDGISRRYYQSIQLGQTSASLSGNQNIGWQASSSSKKDERSVCRNRRLYFGDNPCIGGCSSSAMRGKRLELSSFFVIGNTLA